MQPTTDKGFIHTYTGKRFYPLEPRVDDIDIKDIAHALSMQCRFTGHTRTFYSVAEHSVRVSLACANKDAMWGLLHDAAEAYLHDLVSPLKYADGFEAYREAEAALMAAVAVRFGLDPVQPKSVHRADAVILHTEARDLLHSLPDWADATMAQPRKLVPLQSPFAAERWYMERFGELQRKAKRAHEAAKATANARPTLAAPVGA